MTFHVCKVRPVNGDCQRTLPTIRSFPNKRLGCARETQTNKVGTGLHMNHAVRIFLHMNARHRGIFIPKGLRPTFSDLSNRHARWIVLHAKRQSSFSTRLARDGIDSLLGKLNPESALFHDTSCR